MKKTILIFIILVLPLLYYLGVFSRDETLPFSKEFFSSESVNLPDQSWEIRKGIPLDKKELEHLYQLKLNKGIRNIPFFSFALIRESSKARNKKEVDQSLLLATYAIKFSPDFPQPHFELAKALWVQNPFQIQAILSKGMKGFLLQFRYFLSAFRFYYNVFYILSHAILMAFIAFSITMMIKYLPLYLSEIRKNITQEFSRLLLNSLKIFFLLVPFFLRLDMLWALFFWSVLLWGFITKRERPFIVIFLIILVYLPFFLRSSSSFLNGGESEIILEINQVNHEDWGRSTEERLQNWLLNHPDDSEVLFSLGLAKKRQGDYLTAEAYYRKAIQQDPRFSEAYSNLGNVYLAQKQTSLAMASYQEAIGINPDRGAFYFNLSRAYSQETLLSKKTDQAIQKARQLDPELIDYYTNIDTPNQPPNFNRLVIDEVISSQRLWKRFLAHFVGREGFLFVMFKAWFEKIPSRIPFLAPILFLAYLLGIVRYSRNRRFLTRCPMCGSATYRFYLGTTDQEFICFNCYRIFIQKEKLHPKMVEKKSNQVQEFQKDQQLVSRWLSFFLLGFSELWKEKVLKGLLFLCIFFIFILKFIHWNGVMPSSLPLLPKTFWGGTVWIMLFLLYYYWSVRRVYRMNQKAEERITPP